MGRSRIPATPPRGRQRNLETLELRGTFHGALLVHLNSTNASIRHPANPLRGLHEARNRSSGVEACDQSCGRLERKYRLNSSIVDDFVSLQQLPANIARTEIKVPGTWVLMFCQFSPYLTLTPGRDRCARGSESRRIRSVAWERSHPGVRFRWVRVLSRTLPRRELSGFLGHH